VQLLKRVQMTPEVTLVGGILRFESMAALMRERLPEPPNVLPEGIVQYVAALGCAVLGRQRLESKGTVGETSRAFGPAAAATGEIVTTGECGECRLPETPR
jgi:hypothetical protein